MAPTQDLSTFLQEIDRSLNQLMTMFRTLNNALPKDADKAPFQNFFRELFALQNFFEKHRDNLDLEKASENDREKHFEWLYKSGLVLHSALGGADLLELALDTVLEMVRCRRGFIAEVNEDGEFSFIAARNFQRQTIAEPEREISRSVIQRAWQLKREVRLEKAQTMDQSMLQKSSIMRREGGALICVPVFIEDRVCGVIYLDQFTDGLTLGVANLIRNFSTQLGAFMKRVREFESIRANSEQLMDQLKNQYRFDRIIGKSKPMVQVLKTVAKIAPTDASVLIQGETGTGKDLIARALHENSQRAGGPYIEVDCGALAENLIESELFGHVKGAFTGAQDEKMGLLAAASGGTLFLDEINNMPKQVQTKLLRVLQQRKVRRIGETVERGVDFRLITASSTDLGEMARQDRFRQDLFYRINTVSLSLPPLRQRKDDLLVLTTSFLEKFASLYGKRTDSLTAEAIQALESHDWPGNVRELEHVIERAVLLAEGPKITAGDLPFASPFTAVEEAPAESLEAYLQNAKKHYIAKVLRQNDGKKVDAAKQLRINRSHLFQLIKQLGIES